MRLPDFGSSESVRAFRKSLYREHLEEAAFLYDQRRGLFDDPDIKWLEIEKFEERLEAHIDGLVVGGELALEICRRQGEEGEPGELYAGACVFCRRGRPDLLGITLNGLEPQHAARAQAVRDAMKDEMPVEWAHALGSNLTRGFQKLIPIFAEYSGYRRVSTGIDLNGLIGHVPDDALAPVVWALGRLPSEETDTRLRDCLRHANPEVRASAAIALLRRGDIHARGACRVSASQGDSAMYLPLAACGQRSDAALLQECVVKQEDPAKALMALGVLGDVGTVRFLVEHLEDDAHAGAAAAALQLITGAPLREEIAIDEEVKEDELFDEELQAYRETGEAPKHADGRPFGTSVTRTSRASTDWQDWLSKHKTEFEAGRRYRLGKPFSPGTLVDTLFAASSSRQVRSLAYEELVIRYQIDVAFEAEMRVGQQKAQINMLARVCRSREASFERGCWYFAGGLT
jgi:uncharacterized protein (TIGR02270 family)